MRISDWSSDVCSSDLLLLEAVVLLGVLLEQHDEGQLAQALHHLDAPVDDLLGEVVLDRRLDATFKQVSAGGARRQAVDRSEEHTSELQSLMRISYAVFCLKKKNKTQPTHTPIIASPMKPTLTRTDK